MKNTTAGHWLKKGLTLLALGSLSAPAGALDMMIWDQGLETKLAYGESEGGVLRGQVVRGASGSVVILFSRSEVERNRSLYPGLRSRYEGQLRGGEIMIKVPGGVQTLEQFLAAYKLKLDLNETSGGK